MVQFAWHVHHNALFEPLIESIEKRIIDIKEVKSKVESPERIELRLRLLKIVIGPLPDEVIKAGSEAHEVATAFLSKGYLDGDMIRGPIVSDRELRAAITIWSKAKTRHKFEIEELHKKECPDCPWDGTTIFAR